MLTPAQKKIRQNLEEIRVNGLLLHDKKKAELPIKNTKRNYPLFSIFLLVTICSFIAIAVYSKQFDQSQESIINYLTHTQSLSTEGEKLLNDCLEQQGRLKITEIKELSLKQEEFMRKAIDYAVPAGFSEHNHDFINLMEQRSSMINTITAEPSKTIQLNEAMIELKVKQALQRDSLMKALKRVKIEFVQTEDGTVEYWFKDKTYLH